MRNLRLKAGPVGENAIARWGICAGMLAILTLAVLPATVGLAAVGDITTVAGGFTGDEGPATGATLIFPSGLVVDGSGNLFFADPSNHRIRKVDAVTGVITTVVGSGPGGVGFGGFCGDGGPTLANSDAFGNGVSSIGDLNGDGVEDLAVGAFADGTGGKDRGAVYVLFMNANGTVSSYVKIASGANGGPTLADDDAFGVKVSSVGDLNGDGVQDMAVGAYNDNTGGPDRGAVYVLFMNANGTVSSYVKIASGANGDPATAATLDTP